MDGKRGGEPLENLVGEQLYYLTRKETTQRPKGANSGATVSAAFLH